MATVIKKTGTTDGKSNALGGGGRFKQMVASGNSPALAAFIGRKIYGKKKMTQMATKKKKKVPAEENTQPMMAAKGMAIGNPNLTK